MNKSVKVLSAVTTAALVFGSAITPVLAATTYDTDSVGSAAADSAHINNDGTPVHNSGVSSNTSGVTGYDAVQGQESEYKTYGMDTSTATVDVYATQSTGSDVPYDSNNDGVIDENDTPYDGSVTVLIPKVIILNGASGSNYSGAYTVKVKGNLAGDDYVTVAPQSNSTAVNGGATAPANGVYFFMGQTGKDDIVATVSQANTKFSNVALDTDGDSTNDTVAGVSYTGFNENAKATGTVTASNVTAGSWHGTFNFRISLNTVD
jgi:hypothetical protein